MCPFFFHSSEKILYLRSYISTKLELSVELIKTKK